MNTVLALNSQGQTTEVITLARSLTMRFPLHGFGWKVLGTTLLIQGQLEEALLCMQKTTRFWPGDAAAHGNLGLILQNKGRLAEAEASLRRALALKPDFAEAHNNLGITLKGQGRLAEAETSLRRALALKPDYAEAHGNLGNTLADQGRLAEAEPSLRRVLALKPDLAEAHNNLGVTLRDLGRLAEAEASLRRALAFKPDYVEAHNNLGNTLKDLGRFAEAEASVRRALAIKPDFAQAHSNLGVILQDLDRLAEAEASMGRALALKPDFAQAHSNLGSILSGRNRQSEAVKSYRFALEIKADHDIAHNSLLFCLSHDLLVEPQQLYAEHLAFGEQFEPPLRAGWQPHNNAKDPARCLQVGFVSGDLCNHALANFLEPVFKFLAKKQTLSLHAYATKTREDAVTQRLRNYFAHWHAVANLGNDELANKIRADGIDILIDLSGHTSHNRLLTFARKPAPIQASWLGYLGTTGLQAMDYYLCDQFWIPPGELDWQFTEKPAYLPAAVVFQPSELAPPVNTLPALENGYLTFGSFNRPNKLNASVIVLWSMLLRDTPNSRMVLGAIPLDSQDGLIQSFAHQGIEQSRLVFYPRSNLTDYLALHHQVDLCLDTYPYGGGATTAHAAWMGVPTLSLAGESPASRFGATEMHHLGLDGFIATSIEDFVAKGCYWAEHIAELAELRTTMRARFEASPLGQPQLFADNFEILLRTMWQHWCSDLPSAPIEVEAPLENKNIGEPSKQIEPNQQELEALANLYHQQHYNEAESLSRVLVSRFPEHGFGWRVLGTVLNLQGHVDEALQCLQKASKFSPRDPVGHNDLGVMLKNQGRFSEAETSLRRALTLNPYYAEAHGNLGNTLADQGQLAQAEASLRRALALKPDLAELHYNLGITLRDLGRFAEAESSLRQALVCKPDYAEAHSYLGGTLKDLGRLTESETSLRQSLALNPNHFVAHVNLALTLHDLGRLAESEASLRCALALKPHSAMSHRNLGNILVRQDQLSKAMESFRCALAITANDVISHSNLLFCMSHDILVDPQQLYAEHLAFGEQFEAPLRAGWPPHDNAKDPARCLQVGFVTGDLRGHPLINFLEPVFKLLAKKTTLTLHAYVTQTLDDAVTDRMRNYFAHWHAVASLNDVDLTKKIHADGIDILIDLSGHTAHNRLLTFARKPAPIQASWLGYLGTTGLQGMDYYLCDPFWIPPGELDWQFTEKPAYLPAAVVFQPSELAPPVKILPALANGYVTFGSFNRPNKLNASVIALWSMLLRDIPSAKLVLGAIPLASQNELIQSFSHEGIEPNRLVFYPRTNLQDYLALHHQVDFCLDTYPYGGGATTAHAAWMGVPTLSLAGESPASRFGATEMHHLGLDGFIATSIDDFVAKGCYWAAHIAELAELRTTMRARFEASPLGQPQLFADNFDALLRTMWQRWCNDLPSEVIEIMRSGIRSDT